MSDVKQRTDHVVSVPETRVRRDGAGTRAKAEGGDEFQSAIAALTQHQPLLTPFEKRTVLPTTTPQRRGAGAHVDSDAQGSAETQRSSRIAASAGRGEAPKSKAAHAGERRRQEAVADESGPSGRSLPYGTASTSSLASTSSASGTAERMSPAGVGDATEERPGESSSHAQIPLEAAALQAGPSLMVMQALEHTANALSQLAPPPRPAILQRTAESGAEPRNEPQRAAGKPIELRTLSQAEGLHTSSMSEATFELRHPVFGRLGVRLALAGKQLSLALIARTGTIAESIVAQRDRLAQWLSEQGYERVEVSVEIAAKRAEKNGKGLASTRENATTRNAQRPKRRARTRPGTSNLTLDTEA